MSVFHGGIKAIKYNQISNLFPCVHRHAAHLLLCFIIFFWLPHRILAHRHTTDICQYINPNYIHYSRALPPPPLPLMFFDVIYTLFFFFLSCFAAVCNSNNLFYSLDTIFYNRAPRVINMLCSQFTSTPTFWGLITLMLIRARVRNAAHPITIIVCNHSNDARRRASRWYD